MDKVKQREVVQWLKMNIKAEKNILKRLIEEYGAIHKKVKAKKSQIKDLEERVNKLLN